MDEIIKQIRSYLNMSQTEFAELMNVSFGTVNRWENGRAVPNKLAQVRLYEICQERNVPVYDFTLSRINQASKSLSPSDGKIILYHGSKSGIEGAIAPKSREQCDFGRGFYMGTEAAQALTLICDYDKSKFYIVSLDTTQLDSVDIQANLDWAMLVAYHRGRMEKIKGTPFYAKYRDWFNFYVIDNFFVGNITDAALVNSLSALQLGRQYVAVTQKCCDVVHIEAEIELSHLERLFIKEVAQQNRVRGVSLANEICRTHRREGLYFDEILEKAQNGGL